MCHKSNASSLPKPSYPFPISKEPQLALVLTKPLQELTHPTDQQKVHPVWTQSSRYSSTVTYGWIGAGASTRAEEGWRSQRYCPLRRQEW